MGIEQITKTSNYFWYKELALCIIIGQYLFDQYLNWRQLKRLYQDKELPPILKKLDVNLVDFQKAKYYSRDKMKFDMIVTLIKTILEVLLIWYFYYPYIWNLASQILSHYDFNPNSEYLRGLLFITIETIREKTFDTPLEYYKDFVIEARHGFNKKTKFTFIKDLVLEVLLKFIFTIPILYGFLWIVEAGGQYFYIYVEIFVIIVMVIMMTIYPHFIAPLFNKFTELEDGPLKDAINDLAKKLNFPLKKVFVVDGSKRSSHSNAYFYGFGSNKRIVLFDTLLNQMTNDEIIAVLAHEMGHWQKGHVWKHMINAFLQVFILFYVYGFFMSNPDIFLSFGFKDKSIFIGVILFTLIYSPVMYVLQILSLKVSRAFEFQADEFATRLNYGDLLSSGLLKLFKENSGDMDPDPVYASFHFTHPTLAERLEYIRNLQQKIKNLAK